MGTESTANVDVSAPLADVVSSRPTICRPDGEDGSEVRGASEHLAAAFSRGALGDVRE